MDDVDRSMEGWTHMEGSMEEWIHTLMEGWGVMVEVHH